MRTRTPKKVAEVMLNPVAVVALGTDLEKAMRLMFEKKIKKVPVRDKIA